jgi:hypothetical protein
VLRIVDAHEDVCATVRHRPMAKGGRLDFGKLKILRHGQSILTSRSGQALYACMSWFGKAVGLPVRQDFFLKLTRERSRE